MHPTSDRFQLNQSHVSVLDRQHCPASTPGSRVQSQPNVSVPFRLHCPANTPGSRVQSQPESHVRALKTTFSYKQIVPKIAVTMAQPRVSRYRSDWSEYLLYVWAHVILQMSSVPPVLNTILRIAI